MTGEANGRPAPAARRRDGRVQPTGLLATTTWVGAGAADESLPWMASNTSCRCTGTSLGATMPKRTLSPRISTTVTTMSLLMTILSFFFLDSTSIAGYPSQCQEVDGESGRNAITSLDGWTCN